MNGSATIGDLFILFFFFLLGFFFFFCVCVCGRLCCFCYFQGRADHVLFSVCFIIIE